MLSRQAESRRALCRGVRAPTIETDSFHPHCLSRGRIQQPGVIWLKLSLVVLLGCLLRVVGLGKESLWLDEATSLIIARMNPADIVLWAAADVHPPLYYLLLHIWLRLGESEVAIRSLSAVWGVLGLVLVFALTRELLGNRVALWAALLLALSPLHIWYSQEARMYAMVTTLCLLAAYLLILALRRTETPGPWNRYWLGYIVAAVLALYTHYYALWALFSANLFALYWLVHHAPGLWRRWMLAQLTVFLLFLPWLPILYHQVTTGGGGWVERAVGRPSLYALVDTWLYFGIGLDSKLYPVLLRRLAYLLFFLSLLMVGLRLLCLNWNRSQSTQRLQSDREGLLFCLTNSALAIIVIWLVSQAKPMFSIRYLLVFLPFYCILIAYGIHSLPARFVQVAVLALLAVTLLIGNWNAWRVGQNPDWREVACYVMQEAQPGDVVLFSPRWNIKPFDYYARGRIDTNMDLPIPVTTEVAEQVVKQVEARWRRVWLLWQSGHYSDPDGIAKQILDRQYAVLEEREIPGIDHLILYDLTAGSER